MNRQQISDSAGSLYVYEDAAGSNMDSGMDPPEYFNDQLVHNTQHQPAVRVYTPTSYFSQQPNQWSATTPHFADRQRLSSLSFSSGSSSFRSSSNNSIFSQDLNRNSCHSIDSELSQTFSSSAQIISQTAQQSGYYSTAHSSHVSSPTELPISQAQRKHIGHHKVAQKKDQFSTCVSVTKQPRPCNSVQKYFCTACKKLFVEKADWKRHEETYQERPELFQCDQCSAIYFLDRDFTSHHIKAHGCSDCRESIRCSKKRHVQVAKKPRQLRTGWGCGFCIHFSSSWTARCNHIAKHIEKEGKTLADWQHNYVIYSLLQRPAIRPEWEKILSKRRGYTPCVWDELSTSRVEGYPESNKTAQLQDRLEYYTSNDDATALAQLAYSKTLKQADPLEFPDAPPLPPPKDQRLRYTPSLPSLSTETESWTQFLNAVTEDEFLATGVDHLEGWRAW